jgi:hypothetical protein
MIISHSSRSTHPGDQVLIESRAGVCSFHGGFGPRQSSSDYFVLFFRWSAHSESCAALGGLGFHARDPTAIHPVNRYK